MGSVTRIQHNTTATQQAHWTRCNAAPSFQRNRVAYNPHASREEPAITYIRASVLHVSWPSAADCLRTDSLGYWSDFVFLSKKRRAILYRPSINTHLRKTRISKSIHASEFGLYATVIWIPFIPLWRVFRRLRVSVPRRRVLASFYSAANSQSRLVIHDSPINFERYLSTYRVARLLIRFRVCLPVHSCTALYLWLPGFRFTEIVFQVLPLGKLLWPAYLGV